MPVFTTVCPRNCYSTCTMKVHVEDGRLRRIEPHEGNRATFEGPCLKGLSYVEREHSPDRILQPMRRTAAGAFEPTSWDDALTTIAERLESYRDAPQSVMFYAGSGTKGLLNGVSKQFWRMYGGFTSTYGDLCWPAGLEATRLTLGYNKHSAPWDIANARVIVLWGKNSAENNIHQMVYVHKALDAGARLIVIDPRRTETAERADLLIQPRPGSDGALALAVANRLIAQQKIDRAFIDEHVHGFDRFADSVRDFTPEKAAEITDVPAAYIEQLADDIGGQGPVTINCGFGMQRYTNSGQAMRAVISLLAITGNIGKPGAGWLFANLQGDVFDAVEEQEPLGIYPPKQADGIERVGASVTRLGRDMLEMTDPALRMLWVERGNPVTQNPETNKVLEAIRKLDFRVVVEQFMTDTAREADIVLPAKTMFEQSDVCWAYWHPYVQLKQKVLEPPGEVKPETEIYWHLAQRLGFDEGEMHQRLVPPGDAHVDAYLNRRLAPFDGITLEGLKEAPAIAPGNQEVAFEDFVFDTPSGKIELESSQAAEWWDVGTLPDYQEPVESRRRKSPESGKYKLNFITPNTKNRIHSQFNNLQMIRRLSPAPFLTIHPHDAASRGIEDGNRVRVFNDRGHLEVEVKFDHAIKPGCVAMTNGWWISEGGTVNFCSAPRETDMGHGAAFHDNLVDVEPAA